MPCAALLPPQVRLAAAFDFLFGEADRHGQNVMLDDTGRRARGQCMLRILSPLIQGVACPAMRSLNDAFAGSGLVSSQADAYR